MFSILPCSQDMSISNNKVTSDDCPICLTPISGKWTIETPCSHIYHRECWIEIENHAAQGGTSPICALCRFEPGFFDLEYSSDGDREAARSEGANISPTVVDHTDGNRNVEETLRNETVTGQPAIHWLNASRNRSVSQEHRTSGASMVAVRTGNVSNSWHSNVSIPPNNSSDHQHGTNPSTNNSVQFALTVTTVVTMLVAVGILFVSSNVTDHIIVNILANGAKAIDFGTMLYLAAMLLSSEDFKSNVFLLLLIFRLLWIILLVDFISELGETFWINAPMKSPLTVIYSCALMLVLGEMIILSIAILESREKSRGVSLYFRSFLLE